MSDAAIGKALTAKKLFKYEIGTKVSARVRFYPIVKCPMCEGAGKLYTKSKRSSLRCPECRGMKTTSSRTKEERVVEGKISSRFYSATHTSDDAAERTTYIVAFKNTDGVKYFPSVEEVDISAIYVIRGRA